MPDAVVDPVEAVHLARDDPVEHVRAQLPGAASVVRDGHLPVTRRITLRDDRPLTVESRLDPRLDGEVAVPTSRAPLAGSVTLTLPLPPSNRAAEFSSVARAPGTPSVTACRYVPGFPLAVSSKAVIPLALAETPVAGRVVGHDLVAERRPDCRRLCNADGERRRGQGERQRQYSQPPRLGSADRTNNAASLPQFPVSPSLTNSDESLTNLPSNYSHRVGPCAIGQRPTLWVTRYLVRKHLFERVSTLQHTSLSFAACGQAEQGHRCRRRRRLDARDRGGVRGPAGTVE